MMGEDFSDCYNCSVEIDKTGHPILTLCPKHAAADAMYEALESRQRYEYVRLVGQAHWHAKRRKSKAFWNRYERLVLAKEYAALALADGD
jgi:hypothetical protein